MEMRAKYDLINIPDARRRRRGTVNSQRSRPLFTKSSSPGKTGSPSLETPDDPAGVAFELCDHSLRFLAAAHAPGAAGARRRDLGMAAGRDAQRCARAQVCVHPSPWTGPPAVCAREKVVESILDTGIQERVRPKSLLPRPAHRRSACGKRAIFRADPIDTIKSPLLRSSRTIIGPDRHGSWTLAVPPFTRLANRVCELDGRWRCGAEHLQRVPAARADDH
jgi:hypothetical protein